jgi:hypothetical protein
MAARNFNAKQALEKEVKDLYARIAPGNVAVAATATLDLTTDIVLTSVASGAARNTSTFELVVNAAAANPAATVLVAFTGTAAAIVCTVTPNDGTNNSATPVSLDEDELAELINSGVVVGKTITLTDVSSLRALQTATGGAAANALTSGDDQSEAFAGGITAIAASVVSGEGVASVVRSNVGQLTITLDDAYWELKHADAILLAASAADVRWQWTSELVNTTKVLVLQARAGASAVAIPSTAEVLVKFELKNSSAR